MKAYFFLVLIALSGYSVLGENSIRSEAQITEQFLKYVTKSQNITDKIEFKKIIEIFSFPQYVLRNSFDSFTKPRQTLTCIVCRSVINTVKKLQNEGQSEEELVGATKKLCTELQIQSEAVCEGAVGTHMPIILYVMRMKESFSAESFCGIAFQSDDINTCPFEDEELEWTVDLPVKNVTNQPPPHGDKTFKIVQLSDLHYDPIYEPYGLADCNEPTCCRAGQSEKASPRWSPTYNDESAARIITRGEKGSFLIDLNYADEISSMKKSEFESSKAIPEKKQAGYWGDYRHCDAPWWAIEDTVDKIIENHNDYDYVYYTGDTIDHGVWETTEELITESQRKTMEEFKNKFGDIPVLNVIGNHEPQPVNQFAPASVTDPKFSSAWMYNMLAEKWSVWLPADTAKTIKLGGYYTMLLRPGFRVIVINSNICYRQNWWILLEPNDPSGQLKWLIDTLEKAELNDERVHILSHLPAGRADCYATYTREYKRIVERFSDTIAAEFNGHTHHDQFKIFYSKDDINRPLTVAWNGGSVTANSDVNPNYRIYEIDNENYEVADIETWIYNLTEANLTPSQRPKWFKEYTFKENYGLVSLSLDNLDNLLTRMVTTEKHLLQEDYHLFYGKSSDPYADNKCGNGCAQNYLRGLSISELYDNRKFESLWETFNNPQK